MVWFLVQFGKTYTREFFNDFKLVSCNFDSLWKIHSCMFFPNCTRNYYLYIFHVFFTSSSSQTNRACDEKCQDRRRSEEDGGRCSFTWSVRLVNLLLYPLYHFSCSEYFHKSGSVLELSLTFNTRSTRVWSDHVQFNSALLKSNHINLLFSDVSLVSMRALHFKLKLSLY